MSVGLSKLSLDLPKLRCSLLRSMTRTLHDTKDLIPWKAWYLSGRRSCRILCIKSSTTVFKRFSEMLDAASLVIRSDNLLPCEP